MALDHLHSWVDPGSSQSFSNDRMAWSFLFSMCIYARESITNSCSAVFFRRGCWHCPGFGRRVESNFCLLSGLVDICFGVSSCVLFSNLGLLGISPPRSTFLHYFPRFAWHLDGSLVSLILAWRVVVLENLTLWFYSKVSFTCRILICSRIQTCNLCIRESVINHTDFRCTFLSGNCHRLCHLWIFKDSFLLDGFFYKAFFHQSVNFGILWANIEQAW